MCREKPQQILHYHGKKAKEMYSRLKEVYDDPGIPPEGRLPDPGEEDRDYLLTEYRHDFRGSLTDRRDTLGSRWHYGYDVEGNPVSIKGPSGAETRFTYDGLGREKSRINGEGETEYSLDYDAIGRVTARTDGEGNTTRYEYHPTGKVTAMSGSDAAADYRAEYDIWGRPDSETDGNGNKTLYEKDLWGRVTKVTLPDGGTEHYEYDYAGNVVSATDAMGKETRFTYRAAGRVESIRRADGSERYFGYDAEGRCSYRLDENKNLIRTTYNMDGNPVLMTGSRNAGIRDAMEDNRQNAEPEIRSVYTYDERGFLTSDSEGGTVYHYTRDSEGRILTKSAWGKTLYETSYGADGKPSGIVAQGVRTDYTYDAAGRLKKLVSDSGLSVQYRYDRNGMQTQMLYGNGLVTAYTYDSRSRLTGMRSGFPDRTPLFDASYTYDASGNRTDRQETVHGNHGTHKTPVTTAYGYDSMNRLVSENCGNSRISYKYDLSGNRISRDTDGRTENYLYNSRNQLTQLTGDDKNISYTYDPAGNLTEEHSTEHKKIYSYDTYNRNTEINGNDFTQKNHYDAEGYRYSIEENDKVTNFVYRRGIMLAELDEAGNQAKTYTLGNEYAGHVSELNNSLTSENKAASYYITDEQGSIRYILDQSGEVQNYYQYSAFGETIISEETTPNRLRYNTQTEDELTGFYYLRARYYAPGIGRFTQEDVIYNDGLNLYAYCNSNPVMYSDPSGFAKETCKSKVGGECDSESGSKGGSATSRPTWRQSELDAATDFPGYADQKSFINGKEVSYGTKGSVRPDYYKEGFSVDIKNYNIENASGRSNLARNIDKQYYQRIENLPNGTKQSVMIDIRGQSVSDEVLSELYDEIMRRTNNGVEILFKKD